MTVPVIAARASSARASEGGDAAPWLVLGPSLGTSTRLWDDALPQLNEGFHTLAWDLPGHGASAPTAEPFSVAELADAVIAAADDAGIGQFFYAGDSLGGAVGLALLLGYPDRLLSAAIICSGAKIGTPEAWTERAAMVREQSTSALVVPSTQRWFAPESMARIPVASGELLHVLREVDDESYALCCEALAEYDVRDRLGEIATPVLAMFGTFDVSTPEPSLREIADGVQNSTLAEAKQSGHLAPAEEPQLVAETLIKFFGGHA